MRSCTPYVKETTSKAASSSPGSPACKTTAPDQGQ
jgi:hypothetical protein